MSSSQWWWDQSRGSYLALSLSFLMSFLESGRLSCWLLASQAYFAEYQRLTFESPWSVNLFQSTCASCQASKAALLAVSLVLQRLFQLRTSSFPILAASNQTHWKEARTWRRRTASSGSVLDPGRPSAAVRHHLLAWNPEGVAENEFDHGLWMPLRTSCY